MPSAGAAEVGPSARAEARGAPSGGERAASSGRARKARPAAEQDARPPPRRRRGRRRARSQLAAPGATLYEQFRAAPRAAAVELRADPGYPALLERLAAARGRSSAPTRRSRSTRRARRRVARAGQRSVDYSLPALADRCARPTWTDEVREAVAVSRGTVRRVNGPVVEVEGLESAMLDLVEVGRRAAARAR